MASFPLDIIIHHILPSTALDWIYVSKKCSQLASELLLTDSRVVPNKNDNEPIKKAAKLGLLTTFKKLMNDARVDVTQSWDAIIKFDRKDLFDLIDWDKYKHSTPPKRTIYSAYCTTIDFKRFDMFQRLLEVGFCERKVESKKLKLNYSAFYYFQRFRYNKEMVRYIFKLMDDKIPTVKSYKCADICRAAVMNGDSEVYNIFRGRLFYYYEMLISAAIQAKNVPLIEELLASGRSDSVAGYLLLSWALSSQDNNVIKCVLNKIDIKRLPEVEHEWYKQKAKDTGDAEIIKKLSFDK